MPAGVVAHAGRPRGDALVAVGVGRTLITSTGRHDPWRRRFPGGVVDARDARPLAGDAPVFAWHPVAEASRYELELLDAGGSVAASAVTTDTTASPGATRGLPPGDYQWWVRATTSDARTLRSALRPLHLSR